MEFPPTKEVYEALLTSVKTLEEELKRVRNDKKENGSSLAEVEFQPLKTERKVSRNSLAKIYNENTILCKNNMLLGHEVEIDDDLEWRVKWGQRGSGLAFFVALVCWFGKLHIPTAVLCVIGLIFTCMLYYKNFSLIIAKRMLQEPNVVIIVMLGLCNWSIDIARPINPIDPLLGFLYLLGVSVFVFIDALKVKSRMYAIVLGMLVVLLNVRNTYGVVFGSENKGIVLLKYTTQGNEYNLMKRSIKRSIFIQIFLFSMNGIYTLFKDRKQELLIFATGNIYRETGTASKNVDNNQYPKKVELELKSLTV